MRHPKYGGGHEEERPPSVPTIPTDNSGTIFLTDVRYQGGAEQIGRSMSVPMPDGPANNTPVHSDIPMHPRFNPNLPRSRSSSRTGHRRTSSGGYISGTSPQVTVSIEETIENAMQQPRPPTETTPPPPPPMLPELQHLKNTPPPPPAPFHEAVSPRESSATIDIAIDDDDIGRFLPRAMTAGPALNSNSTDSRHSISRRMSFDHRRNRSSNESFTNKLRSLTRMRSNSRSAESWTHHEGGVPYESVHSHGAAPGQHYV